MHKKKIAGIIVIMIVVLLAGCKPSDKYAGEWYAISPTGEEVMIDFSKEKTMTLTGESGEETFELNQSAAGFQNNVGYYKIQIDNQDHYVVFEDRKDEANAILVKQTNVASDFEDVVGEIVFVMNRDGYPDGF